jgi:hypothetical protein
MANDVSILGSEIYEELGSPDDISTAVIESWIRASIGRLNNLIQTDFSIVNDEISSEMGDKEKEIFKFLYFLVYYGKQARANLGANGTTIVQEISDAGSTVRMVNKNEVAKTYLNLQRDTQKQLDQLVAAYKIIGSGPRQIISPLTDTGLY